jgi:hypothetical protein
MEGNRKEEFMADLVTLETLFGADTPAGDNSASTGGPSGASPATASSDAPAGSPLEQKIADLERLVHRHREQLTGSQAEVARLRGELDGLKSRPQTEPVASTTPKPRISLKEAAQKLLLDNDDSLLDAYEAQAQADRGMSPTEVAQVVQQREQAFTAAQQVQQSRAALQQALVQRHSELLNNPAFIAAVGQRYLELQNDALTGILYPTDDTYLFEEPTTQVKYDMRVLMQASNEVKARQQASAGAAPGLGLTGGSPPAPPKPAGPVIPQNMVVGEHAVLLNPQVQQVLATLGWGGTLRDQAKKVAELTAKSARP